jgi:hypothetical protein
MFCCSLTQAHPPSPHHPPPLAHAQGSVFFGPSRPSSSNGASTYTLRCTSGGHITKIRMCGGSWVHGVLDIECDFGSPQLRKGTGSGSIISFPAGAAVGTCDASDVAIVVDSNGVGFNGATGLKAVAYDNTSKSFASGVVFSADDKNAVSPQGFTNGFSRIIGDKISGLQLVPTNKLALPAPSNTFLSTNSGSLSSTDFSYCGRPSRISALVLNTGTGNEIDSDGNLGPDTTYISGFGISCSA